ncbi:Uncharacterised protein [Vibrio cholerae]|nr:Uncharacterised protein [Vibrio cholerae]CSD49029.1 Uncharacterised protein [Vibrio cholerae]CSI21703.1 Uncharacterised protein [Vibrio cholerae]
MSTVQTQLPHVGNIKQTGCFTGVYMLFFHPKGVLNWHIVARKRHHLCANFNV